MICNMSKYVDIWISNKKTCSTKDDVPYYTVDMLIRCPRYASHMHVFTLYHILG